MSLSYVNRTCFQLEHLKRESAKESFEAHEMLSTDSDNNGTANMLR